MGYYFFMNRVMVSWNSKKQRIVFISTIEAKYITLGYVARKAIQIKKLINEMGLEAIVNLILYRDNKMSITLTRNI